MGRPAIRRQIPNAFEFLNSSLTNTKMGRYFISDVSKIDMARSRTTLWKLKGTGTRKLSQNSDYIAAGTLANGSYLNLLM